MITDPSQSNLQKALRAFLIDVLPSGVEVIAAQANRVPEPSTSNFVVMTPTRMQRLRTNVSTEEDVKFTGSVSGTTLTITSVDFGAVVVGSELFGVGVATGTTIVSQDSGTDGGAGTYTVSVSQTIASEVLSAGRRVVEQAVEWTVQLDFHSADTSAAANMATVVSTLIRDPYGIDQFEGQSPNYGVVPLHADDPRQAPFINENQQFEWRWVLEACLQVDHTVSLVHQYADSIDLVTIDAELYPFPPPFEGGYLLWKGNNLAWRGSFLAWRLSS